MDLYLGNKKLKIVINNNAYRINVPSTPSVAGGTKIEMSNNEVLTDINGNYITLKRS